MKKMTFDCPECGAAEECVATPHESDGGHTGRWYCFHCGNKGTFEVSFVTTTNDPGSV